MWQVFQEGARIEQSSGREGGEDKVGDGVFQWRAAACFAGNQCSSDGYREGHQNGFLGRLRNLGGNRWP